MAEKKGNQIFQRYDYIDALRGLAIIGVLLAHTSLVGNTNYPSWFYNLTAIYLGPRGVQLFFVISAFTLCLSWNNRMHKEKHVLRNFYIRRFFRIAPLFYIAIIYFLYIQNYWNRNPNHFSITNIVTTFLFINGIFPRWINNIVYGGWSIAVEMMFYLLFPFIISKLQSIRTIVVITFIVMILSQFLRLRLNTLVLFHDIYPTYTFQFFPSQLPVFLIGMTTFSLIKREWLPADKKILKIVSLVFIFLLFLQVIFKSQFIAGHYIYGVFFGLLLYSLSLRPIKILVNSMTIHIGKVSYSIYLCHVAILYLLAKLHMVNFFPQYSLINFSLRFLLLLVLSTFFATILYYTIERPGQIIAKKLIDKYEKVSTDDINVALKTW